ncbi:hypothetical protein PgNI_05319 [Pyricularia grisea]|uniref:lytic cellulose monooxygenase (C4-dehydrogenating) n=1 Tax=Pyricularia grisea TaxID=148305 RepID=A0A6P8B5Y1_PYRGI|nr:hypothetical protein PgNI_05319 [Pyricularia grisea]TLD10673.1 hypothetical protein PgNI_05319 [Pyricularia grisea]
MKFSVSLLAFLAPAAMGHYMFPQTVLGNSKSTNWQFIRQTANDPSQIPVRDLDSPQMACYEKTGRAASGVQTVSAGSKIGFASSAPITHAGPFLVYMAQVPEGQDVDTWQPTGKVWFKTDQFGAISASQFETGMSEITTTIPVSLKAATYLMRIEHVALHIPNSPEFYLSCAQLKVTGNGASTPTDLVAFPGAYTKSDPGLFTNIYIGGSAKYNYPGPAVFGGGGSGGAGGGSGGAGGGSGGAGGGSGGGSGDSSPAPGNSTTTPQRPASNPTGQSTNPSSSPSNGSCAAMYGQCGGTGWTGPTCCTSGTCKATNSFYSQCS